MINAGPGDEITLTGDNGPDTFTGGDGNDTLLGGRGTDELSGLGGDDFIDGGPSSDLARQILNGGSGNDVVIGSGYDIMVGGTGDDVLVSQDGGSYFNDQILFGGDGADIFVVDDPEDDGYGVAWIDIEDFDGLTDRLVVNLPEGSTLDQIEMRAASESYFELVVNGEVVADLHGTNLGDFTLSDIIIRDTSVTGYDYAALVAG